MSFSVVIPARYASTRLPGKMLADVVGKPLLAHVVDRANESDAQRVIVATDDQRIADAMQGLDCELCMTRKDHQSGSDRLAEVVEHLQISDREIVVNVQGDEPLVPPQLINEVAGLLKSRPQASMATAAHPIRQAEDLADPNVVKVVFNRRQQAMYFSRAAIPYGSATAWHHVGIYAYRAEFLKQYQQLQASELEQSESLEQLRVLDNGHSIVVAAVDFDAGIGVDTEADLQRVRELLENADG